MNRSPPVDKVRSPAKDDGVIARQWAIIRRRRAGNCRPDDIWAAHQPQRGPIKTHLIGRRPGQTLTPAICTAKDPERVTFYNRFHKNKAISVLGRRQSFRNCARVQSMSLSYAVRCANVRQHDSGFYEARHGPRAAHVTDTIGGVALCFSLQEWMFLPRKRLTKMIVISE